MKVKVQLIYDMVFDSVNGSSTTSVSFALPEHPTLSISDKIKKLAIAESVAIGDAMLSSDTFED